MYQRVSDRLEMNSKSSFLGEFIERLYYIHVFGKKYFFFNMIEYKKGCTEKMRLV